MTGRRDPRVRSTGRPDPTKGGLLPTPAYELALICTGRGQHKRTRLVTARWRGGPVPVLDDVHGTHYEPDHWRWTWRLLGPGAEPEFRGHRAIEFSCPRCTRRPRPAEQDLLAIVDAARRAGLHEFDVSRLDAG